MSFIEPLAPAIFFLRVLKMPSPLENRWIVRSRPNPQATSRLFCFPYAGGGAQVFRSWTNRLPASTEVCAVQLPGRGSRISETPFSRMPPLVSALTDAMLPLLDKPFGFFGHSMGAWLSFEVARRLRNKHRLEPFHLFVSGAWAPQVQAKEAPIHDLPETDFMNALEQLDGTPKEVLESDELMRLLLPILRADFAVCETYRYIEGRPMNCPITAFGGLQDRRLNTTDLRAWREQTTGTFSMKMLPGNHFFLHATEAVLLHIISTELDRNSNGSVKN